MAAKVPAHRGAGKPAPGSPRSALAQRRVEIPASKADDFEAAIDRFELQLEQLVTDRDDLEALLFAVSFLARRVAKRHDHHPWDVGVAEVLIAVAHAATARDITRMDAFHRPAFAQVQQLAAEMSQEGLRLWTAPHAGRPTAFVRHLLDALAAEPQASAERVAALLVDGKRCIAELRNRSDDDIRAALKEGFPPDFFPSEPTKIVEHALKILGVSHKRRWNWIRARDAMSKSRAKRRRRA